MVSAIAPTSLIENSKFKIQNSMFDVECSMFVFIRAIRVIRMLKSYSFFIPAWRAVGLSITSKVF